jgi:hypothetical protein
MEEGILLRIQESARSIPLQENSNVSMTPISKRSKRKRKAKIEDSDKTMKSHHKRDDQDDDKPAFTPRPPMSGRRHSGFRTRA